MKTLIPLLMIAGGLAGCQTVSQADLYTGHYGWRELPASNPDPASVTRGMYSSYSNDKSRCNSARYSCVPSPQEQWENEFR
jgi:hypothetical protein